MKTPYIIIAIIFKDLNAPFLLECIYKCLEIDYHNYDIYLFPDDEIDLLINHKKIKIFPTGALSIPAKRNYAIKKITDYAEFIAFIDSDAFPTNVWLKNAMKYFTDLDIVAVGGPNITPRNESLLRKISGFVMQQKIGFGNGAIRHTISSSQYINELPTCNLIIRCSYTMNNLFNEVYINAEDMIYCSDILLNGYKIYYANNVIVYHHRKKIVVPVIKQFFNYGYYRSKSISNITLSNLFVIVPACFLLYLVTMTILSFYFDIMRISLLSSLCLYFTICFLSSYILIKNVIYSLFTSLLIFICHLSYGFGFLIFFIKSKMSFLSFFSRNIKK